MPNQDYYKQSTVPGSKKSDRTYNDIDEEKFRAYAAEKWGEGSDFYNQALNAYNAYSSKTWNPNIWQAGAFNIFGDDSAFQGWQNDRLSIFEDALSRIGDASHQESYNSAQEQAARQRAAGLNPDLTGGVDAGQAGDLDNLEAARSPMNDGSSSLAQIGDTVMQVLGMSMNLAQGFQGLQSNDLKLGLDSLNLFKDSNDTMLSMLGNALDEETIKILLDPTAVGVDKKPLYSDEQRLLAQSKLGFAIDTLSSDPRLPRSLRKKIRHSWRPGVGSIKTNSELFSLLSKAYSNKQSAVQSMGHPFNQGGLMSCIDVFSNHVQSTVIDLQKLQSKFEKDRLSVTKDGKSLGTLAGESDASAYTAEAYQKEYDAIVNKMWDDIMKDLEKEDAWWSHLLQFAIPVVRLWLGSIKMPSVSHSTSSGIGKNGNPIQTSSTSFGF